MTSQEALAPLPSLEDLSKRIAAFSGAQYRYFAERLRDCAASKSEILRRIDRAWATLSDWRCETPGFRETDDAITQGNFTLRSELASVILQHQGPQSAINLADMANKPATSDRQLQVAFQANVKVLEAVGVLKTGTGIQVNVDNRRVDVYAKERWLAGGQDAWRNRKRLRDGKASPPAESGDEKR